MLVAAFSVFAQNGETPTRTPGSESAIAGRIVDRARDEFEARHAFEVAAAQKPLRSASLKNAIRDFRANDFNVAPLRVTFGEFITASGSYFVAMHFEPSSDAPIPDDGKVTFFADVTRGIASWTREESITLSKTPGGQWYFERSFPFPAGNGEGTFGLAVKNQPIAMESVPMLLTPLSKNTRRMSRLIVSKSVFTLDKQQAPDEPFAFGGIKVIPNAEKTFRRGDELWIFFEAQNPGLDGTAPKLTTNVSLEGNNKKLKGIASSADPLPLKGVPGHYGVGTTVDMSRATPGDYLLRVSVADAVAGETYELLEKIIIVN